MKFTRPFLSIWLAILATPTAAISAGAQDLPPSASAATELYGGVIAFRADNARWSSIEALRNAAEGGDAKAQFYLGCLYQRGAAVERNREQAARWMGKAAEQGLAAAQHGMGLVMLAEANFQVASEWFEKAAGQGHLDAMMQMGDLYYYGKLGYKYQETAKWFKRAAELGYVEAMKRLGALYQTSHTDLPRDHVEAVRWFRMAAEKGDSEAQYEVAGLLLEGEGVAHDPREAEQWLKRATTEGHAEAALKLAILWNRRPDGSIDMTKTPVRVLEEAVEQGNSQANLLLGIAREEGRAGQPNYKGAAACYVQVLESGAAADQLAALHRLLNLYALDRANPEPPGWLARWLIARSSVVTASATQYRVGETYYRGKVVPEDWTLAVKWLTEAAKNGSAEAMNRMGELWRAGVNGEPDCAEAARWYRRAAGQGLAAAQFNLGRSCLQGEGVTQNVPEAWKWMALAAAQNFPGAAIRRDELENGMNAGQLAEARRLFAEFKPRRTRLEPAQSKSK